MTNPKTVSKEIIVFTSCSMVLTALGIDIMLPAFADVRRHFAVGNDVAQTDRLVTFFFMGQIMQIVFGYLTDKMGRLPILRFGIILYIVSGFATVYAPSLNWMFFFRFISGMGAAAVFMTSIASVRDRYAGDEMARVMSLVLTLFLFTPVIAPSLGAVILSYYSWKLATASVLLGGVLLLGNPPPMVYLFVMIALLMAFTTAGDPNSGALALEFMGENAGLAAAVDGTIFFFIGSGIGAVISSQLTNGVLPLAIGAVVASLISVILVFGDTAKK